MILFPNAKINIGLHILRRRPDGYHDIDTAMVPVPWCDILEMVPSTGTTSTFTLTGSTLGGCPPEKNLVLKALRALEAELDCQLPPMDIYLHKVIPDGAGLGGGSSDASFALRGANELWGLDLSDEQLAAVAARVGADCPFFIYNRPMLARGIGDRLTPVEIPQLKGCTIAITKPAAETVSTRDAYAGVTPNNRENTTSLEQALKRPMAQWLADGVVTNDFETSIFPNRPQIAALKQHFIDAGAIYAAMSGSGAAVYGIFADAKMAEAAGADFIAAL